MGRRGARITLLAVALVALAGCEALTTQAGRPPPDRPVTPTPPLPSADSQAARVYYARVERTLVSQGLLRRDGGGADTPITAESLAENFMAIALYDELVPVAGRYIPRRSLSELRRWGGPIRLRVIHGASTPGTLRDTDRAEVARFADRLTRLTRVPIRMSDAPVANFDLLFLSEDERRAAGPLLRQLVPAISTAAINTVIGMPRDTYCMVFAFSEGASPIYTRALAVIRSEHPDGLRQACIHEELAQAMGLPNDSPTARPSIFNDDEEFGLLTTHDELLLRILYDPRLRPGMRPAEARPIVEQIAQELVGGST